ncbi:hypothetical protein PSQ19_14445 [Devosia algicola]|uniref:Uncharacterized protein n=1 Tax=Devosia algicola TaxID=3026418 RepID=A0ABY7YKS0_9HYPH|nr:hypothetical protein [Devosia algicola]WDR01896.1 hypothetical protein PSQ19_14445 [Devosia algicola]
MPVAPPTGIPDDWDWDRLEPVLSDWLDTVGAALAVVIFNTTMVLECKLAIIDGLMPAKVVKRLVAKVTEELQKLQEGPFAAPQVFQGHLGGTAPSIGAAELPLYRRYFSRNIGDLTT